MKNNKKEDKIITKFDYDFIKNKFENDGVNAPEGLSEESILNSLKNKEQKRIPFVKSQAFKRAVSLVACVAIVAVSVNFAFNRNFEKPDITDNSTQSKVTDFATFSSAEEVKSYFKSIEKKNNNSQVLKGSTDLSESYGDMDKSTDVSSTTYCQVEGVDEADIIKNDGKYIYTLNEDQTKIFIYQPNGESVSKVSEISFGDSYCFSFFIYKNNLIVNFYSDNGNQEYSNVKIYSLNNIKNPKKIYSFSQQGYYLDSRISNGKYLLISNKYIISELCKSTNDYLPKVKVDGTEKCVLPSDIYKSKSDLMNCLLITQINLENLDKSPQTKAVAGSGSTVYCNENNLYIASEVSENSQKDYIAYDIAMINDKINTEIYKISIENGIKFLKKATVKGRVNNQFSMDEYNDTFRIATTYNDDTSKPINKLFVFDKNMKKLGEVDGFAKNESIKAVRYMGATAYVITYENTDPLFVIDLTDSTNPTIKGSVKITGFSTNLIPINSTTLLGIGYGQSGFNSDDDGVKLVLFDVKNPEKPRVLDSQTIANTLSEAQENHKAILACSNNLFAIPYEKIIDSNGEIIKNTAGALVFEIKNDEINLVNKSSAKIEYGSIIRSTNVDGVIYSFNAGKFLNSLQLKN